jgi:8-amino-3,8-dideoxy-alpha-D-manno-octulosonate transaminase
VSSPVRDAAYPGAALLAEEEAEAVARVMRSRSLFRYYGPTAPTEVEQYERQWAQHVGVRHALAVNSGTNALLCALVAAGVEPGDEVVIPAFAWISVPNAVLQAGAIPVVADVDASLTLDVDAVRRVVSPKTTAVLAVHMRGAACALDELQALCEDAGVPLVEDACQAAGTTYRGRHVGSFGRVAAFSTQYAKIVSTGEGGAVLTDDEPSYLAALDVHDPANALRRGEAPSAYPGLNFRSTELQAAIGRVQLTRLPELVGRTRAYARRIYEAVEELPGLTARTRHDAEGENGVAVIMFAPTNAAAADLRASLAEVGATAVQLYRDDVVDLHVARWWRPLEAALEQAGRPQPELAASLELLGRAVQIDVHPLFEQEDVDMICASLARAANA